MIVKPIVAGSFALAGFLACAGCVGTGFAPGDTRIQTASAATSSAGPDFPTPPAPNNGLVTPANLAPIGGGAYVNPSTGTVYNPVGSGTVVDSQTGAIVFVPQ